MFGEIKSVKEWYEKALLRDRNIVACGIGYKEVGGVLTDELCIVVSVVKKVPPRYVGTLVPTVLDGVRTDVQETGVFQALRTTRHRPAPGGVSIGHPAVTAGTLGCLVKRGGEVFILSNNHVLANSNLARPGDPIIQPGSADGGTVAEDQLAILEDFVEVKFLLDGLPDCPTAIAVQGFLNWVASMFGSRHYLRAFQDDPLQMNTVDCAIARPLSSDWATSEILGIGFPEGMVIGALGMPVHKSGRTTEVTSGRITQIDMTVQVMYGTAVALFTDQLQCDLPCGGGDSGSAVLSGLDLVGLLFGGTADGKTAICNRFENVVLGLGLDQGLP